MFRRLLDELEAGIAATLLRLSSLELRSPNRLLDKLMTRGQVDDLLEVVYHLRELGQRVPTGGACDIVIEIAKQTDGSILVLPAVAA